MLTGEKRWCLRTSVMAVGGLSFSLAIARTDYLWSLMSIFYIFLMYRVMKIRAGSSEEIRLESFRRLLFFWSLFPLLIGSTGLFRALEGYFLLEEAVFVVLLSIFAIMIILILQKRTELRANILFAGIFLYSFPIAVGAARAVARFLSDQFLQTEYFYGNTHFMMELLLITIISFYIGFVLKYYLVNSKYNQFFGASERMDIKSSSKRKEDLLDFLNSIFSRFNRSGLIRVSTVLQWGIYGVIIYGIIARNHPVTVWAIFSFGVSVIPAVLSRSTKNGFPSILYFWITLALFVFAVGRPLGFYSLFNWWAEITHFLSGSAVALLLFSLLMYIDDRSENLSLPRWSIPVFVLLFILPIGVFWEIAEFYVDIAFDSGVQGGLIDTAYDLLFNFLGAGFSLVTISLFSTINFWSSYRSKLLRLSKWLRR